ncbi:MAG TPA: hypothetical protein VIJ45_02425 [Coriobacteriia bacterium]
MSDELLEEPDEPMSLRTKVLAAVILTVFALGGLFLMLRMGSPTISSSRTAPAGHYPLSCPVCHTVTADPQTVGTP